MRKAPFFVVSLWFAAIAVAQTDKGLVVYYPLDEGAGAVVHDKSGHGVDGKFVASPGTQDKEEWVEEKNRKVLRLSGDVYIDAGTKANALMGPKGTLEAWCLPEELAGRVISWNTGSNWPDERLVLGFYNYHDNRLIGEIANGVEGTYSTQCLHHVEKGIWSHVAMTYDGTNLLIYVNGEQVETIPQRGLSPDIKDVPLRVGFVMFGNKHFIGRMAEVRIYNRTLGAEELARHCADGLKMLGLEMQRALRVMARFDAKKAELAVTCNVAALRALPDRLTLTVAIRDGKGQIVQEKTAPIPGNAETVPVAFPTQALTAELYEVSAVVKEVASNKEIVKPVSVGWYLPEVGQVAGAPPGRKILNNMVTQLAALDNLPAKEYQEVPFVNPRKGWVFVSTTAQVAAGGLVTVAVDGEKKDAVGVLSGSGKPAAETMRLLDAGEHKLRVWAEAGPGGKQPVVTQVVIRAVPAIVYCGFPGNCGMYDKFPYDFKFLSRDVLPNINTLSGAAQPRDQDLAEWTARGGQYMLEQGICSRLRDAGVLKNAPSPLTGDYAYNYWIKSAGFTDPRFSGVVADEFTGGEDPDLVGYAEAVKRIAADAAFKNKSLYMWCGCEGPIYGALSREFVRAVIDGGYKFAAEYYMSEYPTVEEAKAAFDQKFRRSMELWQTSFPGMARHMVFYFSLLGAPPFSNDVNPSVDYKVFLDMQFQHLATSPEFFGLWGVGFWKAIYADEESLRWMGRLFRHYCIEGNTELLSAKYGYSYNLQHIRNPDFDDGLTGWKSEPGFAGSITTGQMRGLHELLGRYHGNMEGNHFLLMKRSGMKPNRVSQEITGLEAGRTYSMKMVVADYKDLLQAKSEKKKMTVSANMENVEVIPEKTVAGEGTACFFVVNQYAGKPAPFLNYHRLVFRAKGPTARLTISDWADVKTPGGPAGQETLINFIEVQPYLED